eukprot:9468633-Pyramimonas_sp.AAC.1
MQGSPTGAVGEGDALPGGTGLTYGQLVKAMLFQGGLVTLGLYRPTGYGGSLMPYVATNPPPEAKVTAEDRVFVLVPPQHHDAKHDDKAHQRVRGLRMAGFV